MSSAKRRNSTLHEKAKISLRLVYTSDGIDGSGVVSGVGIGRNFCSSVNRHDGSGIASLAFSVSFYFVNIQDEKPEKTATIYTTARSLLTKNQTNETVFNTVIHTGLKSYLLSDILPCDSFIVVFEVPTRLVI